MSEKFFLEDRSGVAGGGTETIVPPTEPIEAKGKLDVEESLAERYSSRRGKTPKKSSQGNTEAGPVMTDQFIADMAEDIKSLISSNDSLTEKSEIKKAFIADFKDSISPKMLGKIFNRAWRLLERQNYFLDKVEGITTETTQNEVGGESEKTLAEQESKKTERTVETAEESKGVFEKGQKIQIEYDGKMVEWKILGFKDNGDPIIQGSAPGKKKGEIIFADWNDIKKWNPDFTIPEQKVPEAAPAQKFSPESRKKGLVKKEKNLENPQTSEEDGSAQIDRMTSIDEMRQKILPGLEQNVRNEIFSLKSMTGGQANRLFHEMLDNPKLQEVVGKEYDAVRDAVSAQVPKLDVDSVMVPYRVVLDNIYSKIKSQPDFDYDTAAAFNEIVRDYLEQTAPESSAENMKDFEVGQVVKVMYREEMRNWPITDLDGNNGPTIKGKEKSGRTGIVYESWDNLKKLNPGFEIPASVRERVKQFNAEAAAPETVPVSVEEPKPVETTPELEPTEDELAKFEEAMSTDGFEEFLAQDPTNLDDRSVAETLKLFEVFRHKELVTNTISTIASERFAEITGFEYTESKNSVSEYISREAFEDPDKMLQYAEQIVTLVEQQNKIKELEAKAEKYKETLPDHKLMTRPEYDEAFYDIPEIAKYFGPARRKIKEQRELSQKLLNSEGFWKSKFGLLKSYLFDGPYALAQYTATLAGFHNEAREQARGKIKTVVGADKFNRDTENQYKAKITEAFMTSNKVREIEFQRNAIHEGYISTREILAGAFLEAKEAIETAKKKIKEEVDKLLSKVSAVVDIQSVQDLLNKNTDTKLYGNKNILSEADVKGIQNRIDLKAREAIDNHVEKALSGTVGKKDNTILGTLKKSMEEYMNSGVASMKSEQIRAQVREALSKVIMKTRKGGKQENKIIHNRAVAFAKINRF